MILRTACLSLLFATSLFARADTEYEEFVPTDLLRAVLANNSRFPEVEFYSDALTSFPAIELSSRFALLGSARLYAGQFMIYETDLAENAAISAVSASLFAQGARKFPVYEPISAASGFIIPIPAEETVTHRYCSDDWGEMHVTYLRGDRTNKVRLAHTEPFDPTLCTARINEEISMRRNIRESQRLDNRAALIPRMELPAHPDRGVVIASGGGGSSNGIVHSKTAELVIDWQAQALYGFLATQIEAQQWVPVSRDLGADSAVAVWRKSTAPDEDLQGTLTIERVSEAGFELEFEVIDKIAESLRPEQQNLLQRLPAQ